MSQRSIQNPLTQRRGSLRASSRALIKAVSEMMEKGMPDENPPEAPWAEIGGENHITDQNVIAAFRAISSFTGALRDCHILESVTESEITRFRECRPEIERLRAEGNSLSWIENKLGFREGTIEAITKIERYRNGK